MSFIEANNVYKIFGPRPRQVLERVRAGANKEEILADTGHTVGLDDVTLSIEKGETFVVMGLSGSGKSTFIRCLNRLIEPTAGEIFFEGEDILRMSKKEVETFRRHKMSMVFQRFGLFPHRNVLQNVAYGLGVQGVSRDEREAEAERWIEIVGLKGYEASRPSQLSGGMQQRVGLARALCTDPEVLLMDEAFSALDPLIRREMQDELLKLQLELHKTIVFITHDLDEALRLGDRVAILKGGRVVQVDTPGRILSDPADAYVTDFVRDVNRAKVMTAQDVMVPALTANADDLPREVLHRLETKGREAVFVVDAEGHYRGVASRQDVQGALAASQANLGGVLKENAPTTDPEAVLEHLFSVAADSPLPLAVVEADGKLEGVIPRHAILNALAGQDNVETDETVVAPTEPVENRS